jgi:hypothetical protein
VDREAVTEVSRSKPETEPEPEPEPDSDPGPDPLPVGVDAVRPGRMPEILVGTGLLLIAGAMALSYLR